MPRRPTSRATAAFAATLLALLASTSSALAGDSDDTGGPDPANGLTFTLTPNEAPAGTEIVATGDGCGTGTRLVEVVFTDLGSELARGEATADGTGAWEVTLRVPPETLQGDYGVVATCSGEEIYTSAPFRVLSASGSLDISDDGSSNTGLLILGALGALLLIGGGVMVFVTQKHHSQSDDALRE